MRQRSGEGKYFPSDERIEGVGKSSRSPPARAHVGAAHPGNMDNSSLSLDSWRPVFFR